MPENALYQEIVDTQNDINKSAHEAAQALNSTEGAMNFENRFNNRANGFPTINNEGTNQRADGFPISGNERIGDQRFDGFPLPNNENQKAGVEIGNNVNANLTKFGAKIENGKLHLVNGKEINVLGNTQKISIASFMQEKRLDGDTYMTIRVDNKDGTHQLAHFATGPNGHELILEKNGVKTTVYDIDKTKLSGPEIAGDVNTGLKTFGAKIENGKLHLINGRQLPINGDTKSIKVENYAQAKTLDGGANMTLRVDNKDGTHQLAHFATGPEGDKLIFEKNGKQIIGYNRSKG